MVKKKKSNQQLKAIIIISAVFLFGVLTATNWEINSTAFNNGTYLQTILDAGNFVRLNTTTQFEMPDVQDDNSSGLTGINMTGNILLLHMNNTYSTKSEAPDSGGSSGGVDMTQCVGLYHMNQAWTDTSGRGNTGTATGATFSTNNYQLGNASGYFDGNDYVSLGNPASLQIRHNLTISVWVNSTDTSGKIVSKGRDYHGEGDYDLEKDLFTLYVNNAGYPNGRKQVSFSAPSGRWTHIVATYNKTDMVVYVDGKVAGRNAIGAVTIDSSGKNVCVGAICRENVQTNFTGMIDELIIMNRSLTEYEVSTLYERQKPMHVEDTSGLNNTVRIANNVSCTGSGKMYEGCSLSTNSEHLIINTLNSTRPVNRTTLMAWIKPASAGTQVILGNCKSSGVGNCHDGGYSAGVWSLWKTSSERLNFQGYFLTTDDFSLTGTSAMPLNAWTHVAATYDGSYTRVYVNGVEEANATETGKSFHYNYASYEDIRIGKMKETTGNNFTGSIDEVSIWNRSLSSTEIQNIYNQQVGNYYSSGNYTSEIKNLSIVQRFTNMSWTNVTPSTTGLRAYVRSCDDSLCDTELWNATENNQTLTDISTLSNNQYFQYMFIFNTTNTTFTPSLYNVTVGYSVPDPNPPLLTLNSPSTGSNLSQQNITFNFTVIDDVSSTLSCSIYLDNNLNQTNSSVLNDTLTNFIINNIVQGSHTWNVSCVDEAGNTNTTSAWNFTNDYTNPNATLISPVNGTISTNNTYNFTANLSDNLGIKNVTLYIYNETEKVNETTQSYASGVTQTVIGIPVTLVEGIYSWFVKVFDWAGNNYQTSNNTLQIIPDYAVINLTSPINNSDISRGDSATAEDDLGLVSNTLLIMANVYNNQTSEKLNNTNCSFYLDSALLETNLTNSSGDCIYTFDKSVLDNKTYTLKVNYSFTDYTKLVSESSVIINLTLNQIPNFANNLRAGNSYMIGDAAVVYFNVTKNGNLYDPSSISINATKSDTSVIARYSYSGTDSEIVKVGIGQYYVKTIVNSSFGSFIRWEIYAYSGSQLISTAIEADRDVVLPTAGINVSLVNSSSPIQTSYVLYDRNNYLLENRTVANSYRRDAAAGDKYKSLILEAGNLTFSIYDLNISKNISIIPQLIDSYSELPSGIDNFTEVFALNQSNFTFTNTTIKLSKKGISISQICKCSDWDFTNFNCSGSWICQLSSTYQVQEDSNFFWFNVSSFSAYAGGDGFSSQLAVSSTNDTTIVYQDNPITFYANYTVFSDSQPITGATCNFSENSSGSFPTPVLMTYNTTSKLHEYVKTISVVGLFGYNITCYGNESYDSLSVVDNFTITADPDYPIFSTYGTNNGTLTGSGIALFNVTVTNTNGSVYLNINGTSIAATNISNIYNVSVSLTNGTYSYNWTSYGNGTAHQLNYSANVVYTVLDDVVPPNVEFLSPLNNSKHNTSQIIINITNSTDAQRVWWYNTTDNLTYTQPVSYNFSEGTHIIYAYANDSYNNLNTTSSTFLVDTINPQISYGVGTSENYANLSQSSIYVNTTFTETNFANITFNLYNSSWSNVTTFTSATYNINWSSLGDGNYYYFVNITDLANNKNSTSIYNITLDTTKPVITILYPTNISYKVNVSNLNYSLIEINPDSCWFSNNSGLWNSTKVEPRYNFTSLVSKEGTNAWIVYCNDSAGNENSTSMTFWKDTQNPYFINVENQTINYSSALSYIVNATDALTFDSFAVNDSRFKINYSSGLLENNSLLAAGLYYLNITINDSVNNINSTVMFVNITKLTPTLTFKANGGTSNLTLVYPQQLNVSATVSSGTVGLDKNNVNYLSNNALNVTLGFGSYIFRANISGNENYSDVGYSYYNITITPWIHTATLLVNATAGDLNLTYPSQINASFTNSTTSILYRNGVDVTNLNNQFEDLAVNYYNFTLIIPTDENNTGLSVSRFVNLTQGVGVVYTYLNGSRSNSSIYNGTSIYLNSSLFVGTESDLIQLYLNDSLINNGTTPLSNYTLFNISGTYNITTIYEGNGNYSSSSETWFVIVTNSTPTPTPEPTPSASSGGGGNPQPVYFLSQQDLLSGKEQIIGYGDVLRFTYENETHTIQVKTIFTTNVSVTLNVRSSIQEVSLIPNQEKQVDLNGDGVMDFSIKVSSIKGLRVSLVVKELSIENTENPYFSEGNKKSISEKIQKIPEIISYEIKSPSYVLIIGVIVILIILLITLWMIFRKKKTKKK